MSDTVLKIVRLPPGLSNERRDVLFKKFGAKQTKTIRKSDKYTITFAQFLNKEIATNAFIRLNQLELGGRRLMVEFANKDVMNESVFDSEQKTKINETERNDLQEAEHYRNFINKLNSWTGGHIFSQPPPPNLCYKYPPPTKNTLTRICIQMIREPAFYNQVLHLMNRMNLPPPFVELESEFPALKQWYNMEHYEHIFGSSNKMSEQNEYIIEEEEEESEVESDDQNTTVQATIPQKRKLPQPSKRLKIPKFVNPQKHIAKVSVQKVVKPEDVFESVPKETRNLQFRLKTVDRLLEQNKESEINLTEGTEVVSAGGFGVIHPTERSDDNKEESKEVPKQEFISSEQLEENRLSTNDQKILPVFKNYHPGVPTHRLYVKNLSKNVEEDDLHFIFKRYITKTSTENDHEYNVRLMQEGRMKGQSFVTLQNVAQAQLALSEVNGYILKDKPMVVQFAKVPKN